MVRGRKSTRLDGDEGYRDRQVKNKESIEFKFLKTTVEENPTSTVGCTGVGCRRWRRAWIRTLLQVGQYVRDMGCFSL